MSKFKGDQKRYYSNIFDRRTILTQDLLRILLIYSLELPWSQKKKHIEEYVPGTTYAVLCLDTRKTSERKLHMKESRRQ